MKSNSKLLLSDEENNNKTKQPYTHGYAELFLSEALSTKLLSLSLNSTVAFALLYLLKIDHFLAQSASTILGSFNTDEWRWVMTIVVSILLFTVNFFSLANFARQHRLDRNDWLILKGHVFRVREFNDLISIKTKKIIRKSISPVLVIIGMLLGIFGFWVAIDTLFVSPFLQLQMQPAVGDSNFFVFSFRTLVSVYMFTFFPPYIYLLSVIYFKHICDAQRIRRN